MVGNRRFVQLLKAEQREKKSEVQLLWKVNINCNLYGYIDSGPSETWARTSWGYFQRHWRELSSAFWQALLPSTISCVYYCSYTHIHISYKSMNLQSQLTCEGEMVLHFFLGEWKTGEWWNSLRLHSKLVAKLFISFCIPSQ